VKDEDVQRLLRAYKDREQGLEKEEEEEEVIEVIEEEEEVESSVDSFSVVNNFAKELLRQKVAEEKRRKELEAAAALKEQQMKEEAATVVVPPLLPLEEKGEAVVDYADTPRETYDHEVNPGPLLPEPQQSPYWEKYLGKPPYGAKDTTNEHEEEEVEQHEEEEYTPIEEGSLGDDASRVGRAEAKVPTMAAVDGENHVTEDEDVDAEDFRLAPAALHHQLLQELQLHERLCETEVNLQSTQHQQQIMALHHEAAGLMQMMALQEAQRQEATEAAMQQVAMEQVLERAVEGLRQQMERLHNAGVAHILEQGELLLQQAAHVASQAQQAPPRPTTRNQGTGPKTPSTGANTPVRGHAKTSPAKTESSEAYSENFFSDAADSIQDEGGAVLSPPHDRSACYQADDMEVIEEEHVSVGRRLVAEVGEVGEDADQEEEDYADEHFSAVSSSDSKPHSAIGSPLRTTNTYVKRATYHPPHRPSVASDGGYTAELVSAFRQELDSRVRRCMSKLTRRLEAADEKRKQETQRAIYRLASLGRSPAPSEFSWVDEELHRIALDYTNSVATVEKERWAINAKAQKEIRHFEKLEKELRQTEMSLWGMEESGLLLSPDDMALVERLSARTESSPSFSHRRTALEDDEEEEEQYDDFEPESEGGREESRSRQLSHVSSEKNKSSDRSRGQALPRSPKDVEEEEEEEGMAEHQPHLEDHAFNREKAWESAPSSISSVSESMESEIESVPDHVDAVLEPRSHHSDDHITSSAYSTQFEVDEEEREGYQDDFETSGGTSHHESGHPSNVLRHLPPQSAVRWRALEEGMNVRVESIEELRAQAELLMSEKAAELEMIKKLINKETEVDRVLELAEAAEKFSVEEEVEKYKRSHRDVVMRQVDSSLRSIQSAVKQYQEKEKVKGLVMEGGLEESTSSVVADDERSDRDILEESEGALSMNHDRSHSQHEQVTLWSSRQPQASQAAASLPSQEQGQGEHLTCIYLRNAIDTE